MHSLLLSLMLLMLGVVPALGQPAQQSADGPIVLPAELSRVLTDYEAYWRVGENAAVLKAFPPDASGPTVSVTYRTLPMPMPRDARV